MQLIMISMYMTLKVRIRWPVSPLKSASPLPISLSKASQTLSDTSILRRNNSLSGQHVLMPEKMTRVGGQTISLLIKNPIPWSLTQLSMESILGVTIAPSSLSSVFRLMQMLPMLNNLMKRKQSKQRKMLMWRARHLISSQGRQMHHNHDRRAFSFHLGSRNPTLRKLNLKAMRRRKKYL